MNHAQRIISFATFMMLTTAIAGCVTTQLPALQQPDMPVVPLAAAGQTQTLSASLQTSGGVITQTITSPVTSAPIPTDVPKGMWQCEWFANRDLLGPPAFTSVVGTTTLQFDWPTPPVLNAIGGFSMRCTSIQTLNGPTNQRFTLRANGGLRLFIDDQPVLADQWRAGVKGDQDGDVDVPILTTKDYRLRLEYYNAEGKARVSLSDRADVYTAWHGRYFNEPHRNSVPVRQSNDGARNGDLVLDWGSGAPAGVNPDNFSAIWEQPIGPKAGLYHFWGDADDELKIFVDGKPFYDNARQAGAFDKQIKLSRGKHLVEVHYAEYTGGAHMVLHWERMSQ